MVTFKKVDKQKLCDDLMVENLKQARRIAALEAEVASLRIHQHSNGGSQSSTQICPHCGGSGRPSLALRFGESCQVCGGSGKLRHC